MKNTLLLALTLTAFAASLSPASAQPYKWKDSKGQTIISDTPPPRTQAPKAQKSISNPDYTPANGAASASEKADAAAKPAAPKTTAEKEMEFKKRQQEAQEKADNAAKEREAAAQKQRNCENARKNITLLQNKTPVTTVNDKGERVLMNESARQQELEYLQKVAEEACK